METIKNVNFEQFEDEFGNLKNEFEVIQYEKYSNGQWVEVRRFESGRGQYIVSGQLYFRLDNSLIPLNMDFNSETCGACYQVGENIDNKKKITGNKILFTCEINLDKKNTLSLHKQNYFDGTCFYTLQDGMGNWKVEYGSREISELIEQIVHELNIDYKYEKQYKNYPQKVKEIHEEYTKLYQDVLNNLKQIA